MLCDLALYISWPASTSGVGVARTGALVASTASDADTVERRRREHARGG